MMLPTARPARGCPAASATSPYVATRPAGIRRTRDRTRVVNEDMRVLKRDPDSDASLHAATFDQ